MREGPPDAKRQACGFLASHVLHSCFNKLHPHDDRLAIGRSEDSPQLSPTADRVADGRRRVLPGGIDLEVAVWVDDFKTPAGHECVIPSRSNAKPASPARLCQSRRFRGVRLALAAKGHICDPPSPQRREHTRELVDLISERLDEAGSLRLLERCTLGPPA